MGTSAHSTVHACAPASAHVLAQPLGRCAEADTPSWTPSPPPPLAPSFSRPSIPTLHSSLSGEVCFISRDLFLFVSAVCTVAQALCWVLGGNWPCRLVGRQAGKREFTAHCGQRCDGESAGPGQGPPKPLGHRRESEEVTPRLGPQG